MEYQIQKLTNAADSGAAQEKVLNAEAKSKDQPKDDEDLLKYRPNPDMMDSKIDPAGQVVHLPIHSTNNFTVYFLIFTC